MALGTVKFFNNDRGYGFITNEAGGKDAFVHISAVERAGMTSLREGQKLSYDLETGRDGKVSASNLADAS
jgi:CspA family cold shock protein